MSQSRTSLEGSGYRLLESPRGGAPRESSRRALGSPRSPPDSTAGSCQSSPTHHPSPLVVSRKGSESGHGHLPKQHSVDVGGPPRRGDLARSYSFMSRPSGRLADEDAMHERFLAPVGGGLTPQLRRRRGPGGSPESPQHQHLGGLATPMMHRKQRSLEGPRTGVIRTGPARHSDDSSPSPPPGPRRDLTPLSLPVDSPPTTHRGGDSGTSTLTERGGGRGGSADSSPHSPHSMVDSGLVSGTTGSRGSQDSRAGDVGPQRITPRGSQDSGTGKDAKRCGHHRRHHCGKHRSSGGGNVGGPGATGTTDSDRSDTLHSSSSSQQLGLQQQHNSSSGSSSCATARHTSPNNSCDNRYIFISFFLFISRMNYPIFRISNT